MRWSRACLIEGRSPFFCSTLNSPTGVPLGYFPTMHLQTLAYLVLRLVTANDVVVFNAIWFFGFASTGVGSFVLARAVVGGFWPSWIGGLGAMLCGPMLMHAHGHLETMQMGGVPLFLLAWIRFVDAPNRSRLALAAGVYLLVVAAAPYFAVLCDLPGGLVRGVVGLGDGARGSAGLGARPGGLAGEFRGGGPARPGGDLRTPDLGGAARSSDGAIAAGVRPTGRPDLEQLRAVSPAPAGFLGRARPVPGHRVRRADVGMFVVPGRGAAGPAGGARPGGGRDSPGRVSGGRPWA